jgi:pilus assembly protein CpaE
MPQHISLVIIDRDAAARKSIEACCQNFSDTVKVICSEATFLDGLKCIQSSNPMIVILGVDDLEKGVDDIRAILTRFPRISVFVASAEKNSDWILRLMRAGAVEYLLKPIEPMELTEALQKVGRLWIPKHAEPVKEGKVISVYNPTGGMGTTTIAVNLAASLANGKEKVALVDLNFFGGDVATFLDVNPKYTLSSVTTNITRLDANFLMSVMTKHASGVYVLTEPLEVDETANITPEQIQRLLAFLKGVFTYIVIDTGGPLYGCNMVGFRASDYILFNTVLNLPALKNAKRYLQAMDREGLHKDKVKLVISRYLPRADIKIDDAEKILEYKVFVTIPN